ncbi:MAG: UDP-N-acetylglucosamine 2-epimerase (non-hydrolyzing) [Solirubrobacterales bacterium]
MHVLTIIGNRPQFIKLAAVSPLLRTRHQETLIHTGQHHDAQMSDVFFAQLDLPEPDHNLGIAGGSNSQQTAAMIAALEPLASDAAPDAVLVYGDTNSTLAGALVAAQLKIPLVHVEAGLRSFDRAMPEEVNRVLTDSVSSLLLAPGRVAAENLAREGVVGEVVITGDVMGDLVLSMQDRFSMPDLPATPGEYFLVTAHRAANVDTAARLEQLVELLLSLVLPTFFPVHPRTRARLEEFELLPALEAAENINLTQPLGYAQTMALAKGARAVLTDSGGLQKEAVWLGTQCITLRPSTEWVETLDGGWNTLVDLDADRAAAALAAAPVGDPPLLYNAGYAGSAVVSALESKIESAR